MSRMIDRNKRDMQPLEGAGAGGAGGGLRYKRGEASKRDLSGREKLEAAGAVGAPAVAGLGAIGASVAAGRKQDAAERDKAITRTEDMQRKAAKDRASDEPKKYAKGGSVSKRADGIAQRGKTNCKVM